MTDYILESIDFTDGASCHFCNRAIPTGVAAHVMDVKNQSIYPVGPSCAKQYAKDPGAPIPNYTKFGILNIGRPERAIPQAKDKAPHIESGPSISVISYLILRVKKLSNFNLEPTPYMLEYLDSYYRHRKLTDNQTEHLNNLMAKYDVRHPLLAPQNLMICYSFDYWLNRMILNSPNNADFIEQLLRQLHTKLYLTIGQIEAFNNWAKKREGFPLMDPECFKDAVKADASLRPHRYRKPR